jgi:uncharacterized membrane protein YqaE (UPF0057 family)
METKQRPIKVLYFLPADTVARNLRPFGQRCKKMTTESEVSHVVLGVSVFHFGHPRRRDGFRRHLSGVCFDCEDLVLRVLGSLRFDADLRAYPPPAFGVASPGENVMTNPQVSTQGERAGADILRVLLAIVLPPVGVFLQVGLGLHFWLNILLTLIGYVPGIVHAVWIILRR